MFNFWRKVLEKGTLQKSHECKNINILDPRYDGPLSDFVAKIEGNTKLEKCWLSPNFTDIFENKLLYNCFKQYLESKVLLSLLNIREIVNNKLKSKHSINEMCAQTCICDTKNNVNNIGNNNNNKSVNGINACYKNDVLYEDLPNSETVLNEELCKLPEELQARIQIAIKSLNYTDLNENQLKALKDTNESIMEEHWNEFSRSEWFCRYQVELLTCRSITLGDIIQHNTAFTYFTEFLEHEGCQTLVEFWLAATNFEQFIINSEQNEKYNKDQALNDAISIYEKYLSLQATSPLGFSDSIRYAVEEAICDEENGPRSDCFHLAVETVLCFLRIHCLELFFSSQHYVHLLSDTIRSSCSSVKIDHSPSSSISDQSIDNKKLLKRNFDPETTWLFRKQNGLSFGRVDPFGRFQRNIEPDPARKSESKITKTVKKWVQKTENKAQEEMAWQVAEMVVKDITNLTMGGQLEDDV